MFRMFGIPLISHTTLVGMTLMLVVLTLILILFILATETSGYNSRTRSSKAMKLVG